MIIGMAPGNNAQEASVVHLNRPEQCVERMEEAVASIAPFAPGKAYCLDMATATVVRFPEALTKASEPVSFVFRKQVFQYDRRAFIRLYSPLHVRIENGRMKIAEWDADVEFTMPPGHRGGFAEAVSAAVIRLFQTLYQGAVDGTLTVGQRRQWMKVLPTFDYQAFRAGLSHPTYEEGKVWSISGRAAVIEWEGARRDLCPLGLSPSFGNGRVLAGDRIGAMVTRGGQGEVAAIDDIRVLPAQEDSVPWDKVATAGG